MDYPIITENVKNTIIIFSRDSNGNLIKIIDDRFFPYFYVENPSGEYITFDNKRATKIIVKNPKLRKKYERKGINTYESDVFYTIRYAIDKFPEMPWSKAPLRVFYFDIEVLDSLDYINTPKPIVSITSYDSQDKKYYVFIVGNDNKTYVIKDGYVLIFSDEKEMLNKFLDFTIAKDPDLLVGWNVVYDINYLINRMKKLNLDYNKLSRINNVIIIDNKVIKITGRAVIDLLKLYKKLKSTTLESYSLENVAIEENLDVKKLKRKEISKMELWELIAYNKRDVEVMVELDNKLKIIDFWDELRRFVGLAWNDFSMEDYSISNKRLVDVYLLRKAKRKRIVLPSSKENQRKPYVGALVINPPTGIFENVIVLDISSMYPNIIRSYNLSPETLDNEKGEIKSPTGYKFRKAPIGLIPEVCSELFELRKQYKKQMENYLQEGNDEKAKEYDSKQRAIKIILNSLYGVMAYKNFRLFKQEIAETVTAFGRELLKHIISIVESQGYNVVYGDTDSVFIKLPDDFNKEKCLEEANRLVSLINQSFNDFAKRWNTDNHYHKIELKFIFKRIAFFGVKKRYVGYYVNEEGVWKEGIEVKGLQIIRSDTAKITKEVLNKGLEMLLYENKSPREVLNYINEIKEKIIRKEIDLEKLVWKVSFDPKKEYKQKNTPFLRGLRLAQKLGLIDTLPSGKIVWIYVKHPFGDTLALPEDKLELLSNFTINYSKCMERWFNNVEDLIKKLLKRVNTSIIYGKIINAKQKNTY